MIRSVFVFLSFGWAIATSGLAKTSTVHSTADDGPGSLRQAISQATNGDTINIVVNGTITLTSGELQVTKSLAIKGPGTHGIISGNNTSRVFHITPGTTVILDSITVLNGAASQDAGDFPANAGGAVYNDHAKLSVNNCTLSGNSAALGGAIFSNSMDGGSASLSINNSTITANSVSFAGAGIFSGGGFLDVAPAGHATVSINNSALTNNRSLGYGGGIFADGLVGNATLTINNSFIDGNSAAFGGGIYNNGDSGNSAVTITNTTLSNNTAFFDFTNPIQGGLGSAIFNDGSASLSPGNAQLSINGSTISNNTSSFPGTIHNTGYGVATVDHTSIRNNSGGGISNFGRAVTVKNSSIDSNTGGGIDNEGGSVALINSMVSNNPGADRFGGITNSGSFAILTVLNSFIIGNSDSIGGGVSVDSGATTALTDSTVSGNSADDGGGIAIYGAGTLTVNNSTISNNSAGYGGAIFIQSFTATMAGLTNCTVNGNTTTGNASAIVNQSAEGTAALILNNDTFSGNVGGADGIFNWSIDTTQGNATTEIANTILNSQAPTLTIANLDGTVTSHGYNLISDAGYPAGLLNGPGDLLNSNPMLGPLQNNGGPTMTQALLKGSPAINAGDPNFNPYLFNPPLLCDQRGPGFPRVVKGRLDIGAYEAKP